MAPPCPRDLAGSQLRRSIPESSPKLPAVCDSSSPRSGGCAGFLASQAPHAARHHDEAIVSWAYGSSGAHQRTGPGTRRSRIRVQRLSESPRASPTPSPLGGARRLGGGPAQGVLPQRQAPCRAGSPPSHTGVRLAARGWHGPPSESVDVDSMRRDRDRRRARRRPSYSRMPPKAPGPAGAGRKATAGCRQRLLLEPGARVSPSCLRRLHCGLRPGLAGPQCVQESAGRDGTGRSESHRRRDHRDQVPAPVRRARVTSCLGDEQPPGRLGATRNDSE